MHEVLESHEEEHSHELMPVSLTMAILAVLVACVTLLGHRAHTEELLLQGRASDQWAFYQAKSIRRHNFELFRDLLSILKTDNMERVSSLREKYEKELVRYAKEKDEIQAEARGFEKERDTQQKRANRFDAGEGFLEFALVITSITLLTRRRMFWLAGILAGAGGLIIALTGLWVH